MKKTKILFLGIIALFSLQIIAQDSSEDFKKLRYELRNTRGYFMDDLYSKYDTRLVHKDLENVKTPIIKSMLKEMLDGTYPLEFRAQSYRNYQHPYAYAKEIKTSPYSQFENPTGIYFSAGEDVLLIVDKPDTSAVSLRITNFGEAGGDSKYELQHGFNFIKPENEGNGYIEYFTQTKDRLEDVSIHIIGGKVNGYFDPSKHTNKEWVQMLNNAPSEILDILGDRVHLAYSVNSLKKFCPTDGEKLIMQYDSIISIQHTIMGLNTHNRRPDNHMFGRVIWRGFMHADGTGAAFHDNTMKDLADPSRITSSLWGIAHEFGHVNQVRPWMKWVGTTEVTNNIYSVWTQYTFDSENPKLEREALTDYDGRVAGGRITSYMESAFIHKQPWLTQAGPDRWDRHKPRDWGGDHFVKLVPFWQLQLYYKVAGKGNTWYQPNFYGDIYIQAIDKEEMPKNDGEAQLNFIKTACDVTQTDLTDFFTHSGMLIPIDKWVDDYTCAQMTITEEQIADMKKYASKYKKPETPVLHYLTANSIDAYKNKRNVKGKTNAGLEIKEDHIIVDHKEWQNVVAYETYAGKDIVKIAFAGAGSDDNKTTLVRLPENATKVEAVAWDGKRSQVYKK